MKRCPELGAKNLRLLPSRKVSAFVELVIVDELWIGSLSPTPRGLIKLVRKGAHGHRDDNLLRGEKVQLVFPIQTSRRNRRVGKPVERDVVEDVVSGEAL